MQEWSVGGAIDGRQIKGEWFLFELMHVRDEIAGAKTISLLRLFYFILL